MICARARCTLLSRRRPAIRSGGNASIQRPRVDVLQEKDPDRHPDGRPRQKGNHPPRKERAAEADKKDGVDRQGEKRHQGRDDLAGYAQRAATELNAYGQNSEASQ